MQTSEYTLPAFESITGGWCLLVGKSSDINTGLLMAIGRLPVPAAATAEQEGIRVLDGGNRFNAYTVARAAHGRQEVLNRIKVSRAFTCHQMLALLEATPNQAGYFVVLDMLRTFYDESVPAGDRKRLLRTCITQIQRIGKATSGLVSVYLPSVVSPSAVELLEMLKKAAPATIFVMEEPQAPQAPRLFQ